MQKKRQQLLEYVQQLIVTTKTLGIDLKSLAVPKITEEGEISFEGISPNDILRWARVLLMEIPEDPNLCRSCVPLWSLSDIGKEIKDVIVNLNQGEFFEEEK